MRGPSGRDVTCAASRVESGLELRVAYGPEDIVATELFRGVDADEWLAEKADAWRVTLIAKGFEVSAGRFVGSLGGSAHSRIEIDAKRPRIATDTASAPAITSS